MPRASAAKPAAGTWPVGDAPQDRHVANRRRVAQEAVERWQRAWLELADELREARLMRGLTQAQVAAALSVSRDHVGRVERRRAKRLAVEYLVRHAAAVGLKASIKLYPIGGAIRDEGQARWIARFVERIGHAWRIRLDVPLPRQQTCGRSTCC